MLIITSRNSGDIGVIRKNDILFNDIGLYHELVNYIPTIPISYKDYIIEFNLLDVNIKINDIVISTPDDKYRLEFYAIKSNCGRYNHGILRYNGLGIISKRYKVFNWLRYPIVLSYR